MNAMPSRASAPGDDDPELLSALADGDAGAVQRACDRWAADEQARRTWYSYHLIGDVMRSEDLASSPVRDAAFLAGFRARLAAEPVVLAPVAMRRRQPWLVPMAAAAGFVAVAGVMVVFQLSGPGAGPVVARGPQADPVDIVPATGPGTSPARPVPVADMIRDPQLQRMLEAHRSSVGRYVGPVPDAVPRALQVVAPTTPSATGR